MTEEGNEEVLQSHRAQEERKREERRANRERIVEQYSSDDFNDGTMLRIYKMFQSDGTLYTYAAIKSDHKWYITGVEGPHTWIDLWIFFEDKNLLDGRFIFVATDYESFFEEVEDDEE